MVYIPVLYKLGCALIIEAFQKLKKCKNCHNV